MTDDTTENAAPPPPLDFEAGERVVRALLDPDNGGNPLADNDFPDEGLCVFCEKCCRLGRFSGGKSQKKAAQSVNRSSPRQEAADFCNTWQ